jgi:hypothetical protein
MKMKRKINKLFSFFRIMEHRTGGMILTGDNRSTRGGKTCASATFSTTNPTYTDPRSNPTAWAMARPRNPKLGNENNHTRSVWRNSWNRKHCTKRWAKDIEPECLKYETDGRFNFHTSVNMNFKSFHVYRTANKKLHCSIHPLVSVFRLPVQDVIKKSVWDCWARGCEVEQKKWHWFFGSADTTVSGRVVLVLNLNVRKKRKKMEYKKKSEHWCYCIPFRVQSCAKTRTAIYFIGIVISVSLQKGYINWEGIQFNIWEESEHGAEFGENKVK